jgi:ankyrin repeat protein
MALLDGLDRSALYAAAEKGHGEIIKFLIGNSPDEEAGRPALLHASRVGNLEMVKHLIENDVNINTRSKCFPLIFFSYLSGED